MTLRFPSLLAGLSIAASLLAGDRAPVAAQPAPPAASPLVMASSRSCDGLRDLMVDTLVHQVVAGGYNPYPHQYHRPMPIRPSRPMAKPAASGRAARVDAAPPPMAPSVDSNTGMGGGGEAAPGPSHHTTTNVQERGVDEADIVKTDGKHVYTVHNNELVIAKTWPVEKTDVAARVTFKTIHPQQLYLRGNEVIVQGQATDQLTGWTGARTRVMIVDVTRRTEPRIKQIYDIEGSTGSSRMVGDDLYLVQNTRAQLPPRLTELAQRTVQNIYRADQQTLRPWEIQARLATTLRRTLLANVTSADIDATLPKLRLGGTTRRMACEDLYIPPNNMQLGMTTLAKISTNDSRADLVGAMVAGGQVYASTSSLYVAAPFYSWSHQGHAEHGTQVHQFSLGDDRTRPAYIASGKVDGQLLNQFSMSEWKGDLRIATTELDWRSGEQGGNHLFVMRPAGKQLQVIGALRGLAKGERIYSGRMIGDKGYLVTFRQTDPLFTLDLRNPFQPKLVGELKVNGFSSYIHPIGDDLLLTIGQDATDDGRVTGVHLQVFDVKDPAHPKRRFHEKLATAPGYSYSAAQNDHHAFMFDPVTSTLAFPMTERGGDRWFNGLVVYNFDKKQGFSLRGRLDHAALADVWVEQQCEQQKRANPKHQANNYYCTPDYRRQGRSQYPISRSLVVDKYILSLSPIGLEIHDLADLDVAATLSWAKVQKADARIAQ